MINESIKNSISSSIKSIIEKTVAEALKTIPAQIAGL
jgi:hypothetical protein